MFELLELSAALALIAPSLIHFASSLAAASTALTGAGATVADLMFCFYDGLRRFSTEGCTFTKQETPAESVMQIVKRIIG